MIVSPRIKYVPLFCSLNYTDYTTFLYAIVRSSSKYMSLWYNNLNKHWTYVYYTHEVTKFLLNWLNLYCSQLQFRIYYSISDVITDFSKLLIHSINYISVSHCLFAAKCRFINNVKAIYAFGNVCDSHILERLRFSHT